VVLVVGPSGAGKDAILQAARSALADDARFFFPRRVVTRAVNAAEDHASLSPAEFEAELARGAFAIHWQAHGLSYGIPAEADDAVRAGRAVVFNASRAAVAAARLRFVSTSAVLIDAPLEVRAARLAERNRESPADVLARLGRVVVGFEPKDADLTIDNMGTLEEAASRLIVWLLTLRDQGAG
jgi:phosphonate metabolism protein PhnN/1,5-bisphosphokinase (PRPP-forming)